MADTQRDLVVYVLARTDLPSLNCGKLAAQVHHAGAQLMAYKHHPLVISYFEDGQEQGADHFNTTLVMGASLADINRIIDDSYELSNDIVVRDKVVDPSYPFLVENMEIASLIPQTDTTRIIKVLDNGKVLMVRQEVTCAWFLGNRTDERFRSLFLGLDLHP